MASKKSKKSSSKAKKVVRGKTATKQVKGVASKARKAIDRASKKASKESTRTIKAASKDATKKATTKLDAASKKLDLEVEKLMKEMKNLKSKGKPKKILSEYNLFIRRQLKAGRTFAQAVRLWKRSQAATKTLKKKPVSKPVRKKPKSAKKKAKRKVKGNVVKKKAVKRKPKPVKKKLKKKIRKKVRVTKKFTSVRTMRPIALEKDVLSRDEIDMLASRIAEKQSIALRSIMGERQRSFIQSASTKISTEGVIDEEVSDEELALRLTNLYFKEIAQLGFKRGLELDAVINAYFYSLARIKRKEVEAKGIIAAIRKAGMGEKPF